MKGIAMIMSERRVAQAKKMLQICASASGLLLAVSATRLVQAKMHNSSLNEQLQMQTATLKKLKDAERTAPAKTAPIPEDNSVARLQSEIERAAASANCTVNEFQANPERTPYISVFLLDTKQSGWDQVSIHVTLKGSLSAALATLQALAKSSVPVEPDSLEVARQTINQQGVSEVLLRFQFRALVRSGAKA